VRALSARGYATDDSVVIDLTDDFCPWNAGRWRIGRDKVEKTTAEPDLACDVRALGCVYLAASPSRSCRVHYGSPSCALCDRACRCNVPLRPRTLVPGIILRFAMSEMPPDSPVQRSQ